MVAVPETPRRTVHRPALIVLAVVLAVAAMALGWWQMERFSSASGTAQNLGYALQWPLFGAFAIFAYFRFVRLERESGDSDPAAAGEQPTGAGSATTSGDVSAEPARPAGRVRGHRPRTASEPREIPAGFLPERPRAARTSDPVLTEYNNYLAELNAGAHTATDSAGAEVRDPERSAG